MVLCYETCVVPCIYSQPPALLQALRKWQLSFWFFCVLLSIICQNCTCTQLFLVLDSFFVFFLLKETVVQMQQMAPGPRSQTVSILLSTVSNDPCGTVDLTLMEVCHAWKTLS